MRGVLSWCLMAGLFAAANVVAAGVTLILGQAVNSLSPGAMASLVWPWFIAGGAGAIAAVLFLRGAMAEARPWRRFYTRS
jgi:predicted lysophospholipase L1 biosynthesis ABC-type transport system permease subunit